MHLFRLRPYLPSLPTLRKQATQLKQRKPTNYTYLPHLFSTSLNTKVPCLSTKAYLTVSKHIQATYRRHNSHSHRPQTKAARVRLLSYLSTQHTNALLRQRPRASLTKADQRSTNKGKTTRCKQIQRMYQRRGTLVRGSSTSINAGRPRNLSTRLRTATPCHLIRQRRRPIQPTSQPRQRPTLPLRQNRTRC